MSDPLGLAIIVFMFWALGLYVIMMRIRLKVQFLERIEEILDKAIKDVEEILEAEKK